MKPPVLTREQRSFVYHEGACFLKACPGSGKTRAIVGRMYRISKDLGPRKGIAVLSFTNTAVDEYKERCHAVAKDFKRRSRSVQIEPPMRHPNFVGTFDSFVRNFLVLPAGIPNVETRPLIVDSWARLGVEVRLRGANAFPGSGVSLDSFSAQDNTIDPETIGHTGLKAHVHAHKSDYERAAASYRTNLIGKGYLSAADVRVKAVNNLQKEGWAERIGTALSARFEEVIVDEAQDCNPLDLSLLDWLAQHGMPVSVVCDPDQAIYGFRHGNENGDTINGFAAEYDDANNLSLTCNFRSSPSICSIAATMRERADPDEAVGQSRNCDTPVHVIDYGTTPISAAIGREFLRLANDLAIDSQQAIILAHKRKDARLAAGQFSGIGPIGNSRVSIVARAVGTFWSSASSGRDREYALRYVERSVLQLMGKIEQGEPVRAAILRNEINHRWLRRTVLKIVTDVPCSCEDSDDAREAWLIALHDAIRQCDIEYADGVTVTGFFTRRGNQEWHRALQEVDSSPVRSGTVHEAKGREYEAVCFVIPPNRGPRNHTEQLIASWESRTNTEFVRVAYVAVTRSKNFVVVALPSAFRGRVETILDNGHVPYVNHEIR